jgi:hypothetical protein
MGILRGKLQSLFIETVPRLFLRVSVLMIKGVNKIPRWSSLQL